MSFYTPNFSVGGSWRSAITLITSQLRKIKFADDQSFTWLDFNPQTNFSGMTVTDYKVTRCRYLLLNKLIFLSVDLEATLAAPLANVISVEFPGTVAGDLGSLQTGGVNIRNAGAIEIAGWQGNGQASYISFVRAAAANFSAGAVRIMMNGFLEVT